jgi:transcriptional regulator with XRE-family HTH domain
VSHRPDDQQAPASTEVQWLSDLPFGEALSELLTARQMGLRVLGRAVGMSHGYLSDVISGKEQPNMPAETMDRIAEALGVRGVYFRERRAAEVLEDLRSNPAALARTWAALQERRRGVTESEALGVTAESEAEAAAKVWWSAQVDSAETPWAALDDRRRQWFISVARQALAAASAARDRQGATDS